MKNINLPMPRQYRIAPRLQGFTLLELLVVMVIIGLLAGYVAPQYFAQVGKSEVKVARTTIGDRLSWRSVKGLHSHKTACVGWVSGFIA